MSVQISYFSSIFAFYIFIIKYFYILLLYSNLYHIWFPAFDFVTCSLACFFSLSLSSQRFAYLANCIGETLLMLKYFLVCYFLLYWFLSFYLSLLYIGFGLYCFILNLFKAITSKAHILTFSPFGKHKIFSSGLTKPLCCMSTSFASDIPLLSLWPTSTVVQVGTATRIGYLWQPLIVMGEAPTCRSVREL